MLRGAGHGAVLSRSPTLVERGELIYLALSLVGGLAIMIRALRRGCSVTARRQLAGSSGAPRSARVPFVSATSLPFALGFTPSVPFEFTAVLLGLVPLAFASAIIRYRLMDVEVIIKRGAGLRGGDRRDRRDLRDPARLAGRFFLHGEDQRNPIIALLATHRRRAAVAAR